MQIPFAYLSLDWTISNVIKFLFATNWAERVDVIAILLINISKDPISNISIQADYNWIWKTPIFEDRKKNNSEEESVSVFIPNNGIRSLFLSRFNPSTKKTYRNLTLEKNEQIPDEQDRTILYVIKLFSPDLLSRKFERSSDIVDQYIKRRNIQYRIQDDYNLPPY